MQFEHSFSIPQPVDATWALLLDLERVGPCLPGASVESVNGNDFRGRVQVKLGPITLAYKGEASFVEKDASRHRAVIAARGKDVRGNGTAAATITAQLTEEGDSTRVALMTDLNVTGKPAQFGRGVMSDVGDRLIGQFAQRLAAMLLNEPAEGPTTNSAPDSVLDRQGPEDAVIDLMDMIRRTTAVRVAIGVAAVVLLCAALVASRRRRS